MLPRTATALAASVMGLMFAALAQPALDQPAVAAPATAPNPATIVDPVRIAQAHNATIGLLTGRYGSTDAQAAADLADVLDDGDTLRVLPILGAGAVQNIADLINLRGIDVAIVHVDALTQSSQNGSIPRETLIRYIAKLFNEEVHVLARGDIASLNDLAGKLVNTGLPGSGTDVTASTLLGALHVAADLFHGSQTAALDQLRRGEIAAMFVVGGQPVPLLRNLDAGPGLHFLRVPLTTQLIDFYVPTKLDARSYPGLIPPAAAVETVAVGALLVTLSTPAESARARRVNHLVDQLFARFDQLRQPTHHPKWQESSLSAQVAGWIRYPEAQALAVLIDQGRPEGGAPNQAYSGAAEPGSVEPGQSGRGQKMDDRDSQR